MRKDSSLGGNLKYAYNEDGLLRNLYQIDVYSTYRFLKNAEAYLRLNNITHRKYTMRGMKDGSTTPAELFSVQAGGTYEF